jgi:hypothetical protein
LCRHHVYDMSASTHLKSRDQLTLFCQHRYQHISGSGSPEIPACASWSARVGISTPHARRHATSMSACLIHVGMPHPCRHASSMSACLIHVGMSHPCRHASSMSACLIHVGMPHPCRHASSMSACLIHVGINMNVGLDLHLIYRYGWACNSSTVSG